MVPSLQAGAYAADEPDWTIMVYMAADSVPELPWEEDINEMEAVQLADWMNVVVLVDPLGVNDSMILEVVGGDLGNPAIVSVQVDDSSEVIPADGEADMTSPDTLSDFVTFCWRNYPADRLALVLWGHSGGWYGLCQDGTSLLQLPDLGLALADATEELGRDIDIVVTDSCVEGVVETMHELREHADWYVGSEISVPAQGFRYDLVLDSLAWDRGISPEEWGAEICEIHRMTLLLGSWSAAIAVHDLEAFGTFADRLTELSSHMLGYADLYRDTLLQALEGTATSDFVDWYLDTGDALTNLARADLPLDLSFLALETLQAYGQVVYRYEGYASPYDDDYEDVLDFTGAAVYAPNEYELGAAYMSLSFHGVGWGDATSAVRSAEPQSVTGAGPSVSYEDTDGDDEFDEATLHWESPHERYLAWVFVRTDAGLQLLDVIDSDGSDIVISGLAGELVVSASAWDDGTVTTHNTLDITLTRDLEVRVRVVSGDGVVTDGVEVVLRTRSGPVTLTLSGNEFVGTVTVPDEARYGDLLTVEVLGRGGEAVAENRTYVTGSEIVLEIMYFGSNEDPPGTEFVLPVAVLVMSAMAVLVYFRLRGTRPED